jgi:hypothetical protein
LTPEAIPATAKLDELLPEVVEVDPNEGSAPVARIFDNNELLVLLIEFDMFALVLPVLI